MPHTQSRPRLYFETRGSGEPILLITGFGLGCALLEPLVAVPPAGIRWVIYDHPGIGRSDSRGLAITTSGLASAAVRVLDELELPAAHIAGMSLGGAIAIELALREPQRVTSLCLLGTTAAGPLGRHLDLAALALVGARILTGSLTRRRLWFGPALYSSDHLRQRVPSELRSVPTTLAGAHRPSPLALLGQATAASLHDRSRRLREIVAPTLVLHGELDPLLPVANARDLAAGIPGSTLIILPGAGHAFELEDPNAIAALLANWARDRVAPPVPPLRA